MGQMSNEDATIELPFPQFILPCNYGRHDVDIGDPVQGATRHNKSTPHTKEMWWATGDDLRLLTRG